MPLHVLPEHVVLHPEHPTQRSLDLLDADLRLAYDAKLNRWCVYRPRLTPQGLFWDLIERVTGPDGTGREEPGEWLVRRLRERDSRYRPAQEAAEAVLKEIRADEQKAREEDEHFLDDVREEVIKDFIPLWQQKADPHYTGKRYRDWEKEPVTFDMTPKEKK